MDRVTDAVSDDQIVYLLGFSPLASPRVLSDIATNFPLIDSATVGRLMAWYVLIPRHLFDGPDAEANLADIAWLTPRVIAHQTAVENLTQLLPFYPASFATLFNSLDRVRDVLSFNEPVLRAHFSEIEGRQEWGIKCIASWNDAVTHYDHQFGIAEDSFTSKGKNYLRQQKMIRDRDERVKSWIQDGISEIIAEVRKLAYRTHDRRTVPGPDKSKTECLANIALLLDEEAQRKVVAWVESRNHSQSSSAYIKIELTGPWPLYSFSPELADPSTANVAAA